MEELSFKDVQDESFLVLCKIKEIFEKNNWRYYLAYGTLIGAVRHKGFIPWDDDIDIMVPREDYEKFVNYCNEHANELQPYKLFHYSNNKKYPYVISRFCDTRFSIVYQGIKDYGLGVFVDIYPLDFVDTQTNMKKINKMIMDTYRLSYKSKNNLKQVIKTILKPLFLLRNGSSSLNGLLAKIDLTCQKESLKTNKKYVNCSCWSLDNMMYPNDNFGDGKKILFNGQYFNVPNNYHQILQQKYGDYMKLPSEDERIPHHHYSVYRKNK